MKKAFTLIELLVVIAIIAILAAILFPVFAQAKEAAKKSADLSNMKQIGTSQQIYLADADDVMPPAYYYNNDNTSANGYTHWTGMIMPYVKNLQIFVSPVDKIGGMAPTNYTLTPTVNLGYGAPSGQTPQVSTVQDNQAPRLSYTANSLLMPRKRRTVDPSTVVSATALDNTANTILLAPLTDIPACINDTSAASGVAYKSHRSTNAIMLLSGAPYAGELAAEIGNPSYRALTEVQARAALASCRTSSAAGLSHIAYTQPSRFNIQGNDVLGGNANYTYADSHAKNAKLSQTLRQDNFQWGTRNYGGGGGIVVRTDGVTQVGG